jgi:hypothetical protein
MTNNGQLKHRGFLWCQGLCYKAAAGLIWVLVVKMPEVLCPALPAALSGALPLVVYGATCLRKRERSRR